jgi:hypothetical protein
MQLEGLSKLELKNTSLGIKLACRIFPQPVPLLLALRSFSQPFLNVNFFYVLL